MNNRKDKADVAKFVSAIRRLSPGAKALIFKGFTPILTQGKPVPVSTVAEAPSALEAKQQGTR